MEVRSVWAAFLVGIAAIPAANAQISARANADGTAATWLAGQMSVPNGLQAIFPAIDNETFTCSLVSQVRAVIILGLPLARE
jgi:hypothetical protein